MLVIWVPGEICKMKKQKDSTVSRRSTIPFFKQARDQPACPARNLNPANFWIETIFNRTIIPLLAGLPQARAVSTGIGKQCASLLTRSSRSRIGSSFRRTSGCSRTTMDIHGPPSRGDLFNRQLTGIPALI